MIRRFITWFLWNFGVGNYRRHRRYDFCERCGLIRHDTDVCSVTGQNHCP